jgi:hypothetical protein
VYVCVQVRRQVGVNTANAIYNLKQRLLSPEMKTIWESMMEPSWVPVEGQEKHDAIEYLGIIEEACFLAYKSNHNMMAISAFYSWRVAAFLLNDWAWLRITGKKHRRHWIYIRSLVLHPRVYASAVSMMLMTLRSRVADRKVAAARLERALGRPLHASEEPKWEAVLAAAGLGLPYRSVSDVPSARGMVSVLVVHRRPYSVVEDSLCFFDGFRPTPTGPPSVKPSDLLPSYNLKRLARTWLGSTAAYRDERTPAPGEGAPTADGALSRHVVVVVPSTQAEELPVARAAEPPGPGQTVLVSPRPALDLGMDSLPSTSIPPFSKTAVQAMLLYWMLSPSDDAPPKPSLQYRCSHTARAAALQAVVPDENNDYDELEPDEIALPWQDTECRVFFDCCCWCCRYAPCCPQCCSGSEWCKCCCYCCCCDWCCGSSWKENCIEGCRDCECSTRKQQIQLYRRFYRGLQNTDCTGIIDA